MSRLVPPRALLLLTLCSALLLMVGTAHATNYIYTGLAATCPFPPGECGAFVPGNPANWSDYRNWSPQGVPGSGDTAIINGTSTVNLNGPRTVARLNLNNGSQFGTGLEGGTITITGAAPTFISSWTSGNFACNVNIAAGAQLNVAGSIGRALVGCTVNNSGIVSWTGTGGISCVNSPTFNNLSGGVFNTSANSSYAPNVGITVFNNQAGATLNRSGGATTTFQFVTFNNNGTVNGLGGTLDINGGLGNSGGVYNVTDGARVNVTGALSGTLNPSASGIIGITDAVFNTGLQCIGTGKCLIFNGMVSVNGTATVGQASGPGTLEIAPLGFNSVVLTGTPAGSLNCAGSGLIDWKGGNVGHNAGGVLNLGSSCVLQLSTSTNKAFVGDTINNSGVVNWIGDGGVSCVNSPTFNNLNGSIFNAQSDGSWAPNTGTTFFNNQAGGVFNKSGAGTTNHFQSVSFSNAGTVNALSGLLTMDQCNGSSSGVFTAANGARVNVSGTITGTLNAAAGGIIGLQDATFGTGMKCIGTGKSQVFNGIVSVNGSVTVGAVGGPGTLEIAPDGFNAVVVTGIPAGSLNCAGTGFVDWKGGNIGHNAGGVVNLGSSCVLRLSSDTNKAFVGDTINNMGIVNWIGDGGVSCVSSPTFNNQSGGVFNAQSNGGWAPNVGTTFFNNQAGGVLNKSGAGTINHFQSVSLSNAGTVNALSGLLAMDQCNGSSSGTFTAANGARVDVSGTLSGTLNAAAGGIIGLHDATLNTGTKCIGAGKSQVFNNTVTVNGSVAVGAPGTPGTLEIAPDGFNSIVFTGTPTGSLGCAGSGVIDWKAGVIGTGSGGVINLASSALFKISSPGNHALEGGTINNGGLLNWIDGGLQVDHGGTINNLNGGTFNTPAANVNIGLPNGTATAINNSGIFNVGGVNGVGKLDLNGISFTNTASGTTALEIGGTTPGTEHDQLNMGFNAALGGTLQIGLVDGFHPNGESFTVMTYPSHTGNFATFAGLNVGGGKVLTAATNAADLVIADPNPPATVRTVSGRVTNGSGGGVAGIKLKRTNSISVATTDASGNYTFVNVLPGSITVSTGQLGFNFTPTSRTFNVAGTNVTGIDFVATVATFTLTGRVANHSGVGMANILISRSGGPNVSTDVNGNFVISGVPVGEYIVMPVLTPSLNGVTFNPASYIAKVTTSSLSNFNFTASYTVTGRVTNHSGAGIPNVQVQRVAGSSVVSAVTDSNGNYTFAGVHSGSYTITPVLTPAMAGTSFTPASRSITVDRSNITNQNFIAMFSVSGTIKTSGGAAIANVLVRLNNGSSSTTVLTDAGGNYKFSNVRSGTYSITPTLSGHTFSPAARNGVVVSTQSVGNQNFTGS